MNEPFHDIRERFITRRFSSMSTQTHQSFPFDADAIARELLSENELAVASCASALGALAATRALPREFIITVDALVRIIAIERTQKFHARTYASALAALAAIEANVEGASARARELDVARVVAERVERETSTTTMMSEDDNEDDGENDDDDDDDGLAMMEINALDVLRFALTKDNDEGHRYLLARKASVSFALERAACEGASEFASMKRLGGVDLIVNIAQGVESEDEFDALMRDGGFACFARALSSGDDDVAVRGCIGLACALPRRPALRETFARDGDAVRRLATLMRSEDEDVRGFSSGLFRALALDPSTKPHVERALREAIDRV